MNTILINGDTDVFLDPHGDDHIVVRFKNDAAGFERDLRLPYATPAWDQAVERAKHAEPFMVQDKPIFDLTDLEWAVLTDNEQRWALDYLRFHPNRQRRRKA